MMFSHLAALVMQMGKKHTNKQSSEELVILIIESGESICILWFKCN